ncbi:MAG: hypothetical protein IJJ04_03245 [Clostridia bacterium]|nr:hypothetical protein [Clostridia bacterium]
MRKYFFLKFGVVLLLFFGVAFVAVHGIKSNENFEFNSFLGIVGIPKGHEVECECGKINGQPCHNKLTDEYCVYINKITNEQAVVSLECAKNKFEFSENTDSLNRIGVGFWYNDKIENVDNLNCIKVLNYFFNFQNWEKDENGFTINLENLYRELNIKCDEKNLNIIEKPGTLFFKTIYLDKDFFVPRFSVREGTKDSEKLMVEVYVAYDKFCKCHGIDNIYGYNNVKFDNNLGMFHKSFY